MDNFQFFPKTKAFFSWRTMCDYYFDHSIFKKVLLLVYPFYDKEYFNNTINIFSQECLFLNTSLTLLFLSSCFYDWVLETFDNFFSIFVLVWFSLLGYIFTQLKNIMFSELKPILLSSTIRLTTETEKEQIIWTYTLSLVFDSWSFNYK